MKLEFCYPNSSGSARPVTTAPDNACDAHLHIYDQRFAVSGPPAGVLEDATVGDYRMLQARLGTRRAVVVQPRVYGTDNRVTLDAIRALGAHNTRGIAVVHPDIQESELERLHDGGIRGVRFTLYTPVDAVVGFEMLEPLCHRIHAYGWHAQLHWTADQIANHADLLRRLPCDVVFDHMARLPVSTGRRHPAYGVVREMLDAGNAWVKLSGPYLDSERDGHEDVHAIASGWAADAPDRVVWGSDWPHPTQKTGKPDDAALFDLLARWVPDAAARQRMLVDNPARLYQFS